MFLGSGSHVYCSAALILRWLLDLATVPRTGHPWLQYLLPLACLVIVFVYRMAGQNAEAGNNLV